MLMGVNGLNSPMRNERCQDGAKGKCESQQRAVRNPKNSSAGELEGRGRGGTGLEEARHSAKGTRRWP